MKINKQTIFRLVVVALLAVTAFYVGSILVKVAQHRAEDAANEEKRSEYYQRYKKLCEKDLSDREKDGEIVALLDLSDCIHERMVNFFGK